MGSNTTLVKAKIETNLPRKRGPAVAGYDKAWGKFMDHVFTAGEACWFGATPPVPRLSNEFNVSFPPVTGDCCL